MKVLWICNIMLPMVAEHLGKEVSNREGWLTGLALALRERKTEVELAVAFPTEQELDGYREVLNGITCYGFYENTTDLEQHDESVKKRIERILWDFQPDVVHCFGTEYDHALAVVKVWNPEKVLLGIQGVCAAIAQAYPADLPKRVIQRATFRDRLRRDSILQQREKFRLRALRERQTLELAAHVTGRTSLDKEYVLSVNERLHYHALNETLRAPFYEGAWRMETCERHSIFMSQGDYPIKGLHYMLRALPEILTVYPDAKLYVAGNSIVNLRTWKDKIKISSYGKYLCELMAQYDLQDKVIFTGKLSAEQMRQRMLQSQLFVCASAMENSPNSLGEAMLLGVPCVAAGVGGVTDLFVDGQDGLVYPGYGAGEYAESMDAEGGQAHKLAETVLKMWGNEAKMQRMAAQAAAHAAQTHNREQNCERLMEIYGKLAGKAI